MRGHAHLGKKYFLTKSRPYGAEVRGSGVWIQEFAKSQENSCGTTPPGIAERSFRGGGDAHLHTNFGRETCANDRANRPRWAWVEQLKPSGTIRRAVSVSPRAATLPAAFP